MYYFKNRPVMHQIIIYTIFQGDGKKLVNKQTNFIVFSIFPFCTMQLSPVICWILFHLTQASYQFQLAIVLIDSIPIERRLLLYTVFLVSDHSFNSTLVLASVFRSNLSLNFYHSLIFSQILYIQKSINEFNKESYQPMF